jgi:hypothetical protein
MDGRKKPGVAFWATVVVVVVLVGYPLSLFPIAWLDVRGLLPDGTLPGEFTMAYCAPVRWARDNGPEWIEKSTDWIYQVVLPAE